MRIYTYVQHSIHAYPIKSNAECIHSLPNNNLQLSRVKFQFSFGTSFYYSTIVIYILVVVCFFFFDSHIFLANK